MGFFDKFTNKNETEPEVILESWSPVCDIKAFVEKSDTCYYFYLWVKPMSERPSVKACWICNRKKSPAKLNLDVMQKGNAPMMPEEFVAHDVSGIELDAGKLSVVWFAEGDAAALLCEADLLCVIPGWGDNRFPGYSKYAKGTGPYAWELTNAEETLMKRVQDSKQKWDYFETDFWQVVQSEHMNALEQFFGKHEKYFAIDGGNFPPKALISGTSNDVVYGITAGVSMIPMPKVEQFFAENVENNRRIELGFATVMAHKGLCEHMYSMISSLAQYPWKETTFFAHGHTIPFQNIKGFAALIFINPKNVLGLEKPDYKAFMGDEINLLWVVPITKEEYDFTVSSGVDELLKRATDLRKVHIFDGKKKFDLEFVTF